MRWMTTVRLRIRSLFRRRQVENEIDEELRDHLRRQTDEFVASGMNPQDARYAALRQMGGFDQQKEECRDALSMRLVDELRQDVGYGLRLLRRTPGFSAIAIATLALGIGGTTAIFTVVDSVLLRPLRFMESHRLTMIWPTSHSRVSPAYLHDWRLESRAFQDMAGWQDVRANLTGRGEPLEVRLDRVTSNFFSVLGTPAVLGRTFTVGASLSDVKPEVILSHGFWQRRYGGDPRIVGQAVTLDGETFTIIGVMPDGFTIRTLELSESRAELWMPFSLDPDNRTGMGGVLNVVGRLAPDATPEQARVELSLIARRTEAAFPSYSRDWGVEVVPLLEATVKNVRLALLVLFGAVSILLLIACANVANLVLSRAATRHTELAIRLSLGATGRRLVRQFLTESLVLAGAGGALGVVLATWGTRLLVSVIPAGLDLPRVREIGVDLRILAFAFIVTLLTAVLFGLAPSINAARSAPQSALQDATRGSSAGRRRNGVGSVLVVSEVALALVLLAGAGLLGRSFWTLSRVNPGFQSEQVLTLRTTLPASRYNTDDVIRAFSRDLLERIEHLPGVRSAGSANYLPMSRIGAGDSFEIEGRPVTRPEDQRTSVVSVVGGHYFEAMGIPLLRGRLPGPADTEKTPPVFIIDERLAHEVFPGEDPIGIRLVWRRDGQRVSGEIIGVVGSVRWTGLARDNHIATTYFWFPQVPGRQLSIVARTLGDPVAMAHLIAAQVTEIDANQPVGEVRPMREFVADDLAQPRFTMLLLGSFAAAALLLAAIGLFGVIAFGVTQRTREIGVRVALGAQHADILRLIMQRGMLLTGTGLAIGFLAALALGRVLAGLLYGITPTDPATLLTVALFLAAVAMLATYLPARRAARLDPTVALRAE
jgi:predicted permease